ncbi:hypothetical protein QMK19_08505 [Streptomyces sp. H10-C2]|uniref:COG4315 family predicted lipoprotein n=1 Tax=unclassified Streptomyces TaxID=2593676 RepID=UPI0024B95F99|nr:MULTISPECIES: hypothetical protein [unclassified Streptomyces]MDJ0341050.1 hypothetical protein [Streptomyces sp. PH10-H1]MDJ0369718.1 hypothetical protein [Streptomyces sp. H10-C2]
MKHARLATTGAVAVALLAIVLSGCSSSSKKSTPAPATSSTATSSTATPSTAASGAAATVGVASSKHGPILVDGQGRTLYLFEADKSTTSTCEAACVTAWPPLISSGAPKAGKDAKADLLGTTKRTDGTTEVTYKSHPLYYYLGDAKPGDTTGQELNQFGAKWYVLNASGDKVEGG